MTRAFCNHCKTALLAAQLTHSRILGHFEAFIFCILVTESSAVSFYIFAATPPVFVPNCNSYISSDSQPKYSFSILVIFLCYAAFRRCPELSTDSYLRSVIAMLLFSYQSSFLGHAVCVLYFQSGLAAPRGVSH